MSNTFSYFIVFLTIFLCGMILLKVGLFQISENKLHHLLQTATGSPLRGLLSGTILTMLLQSSSAVMVMTIGLIAAGHMSFQQSIGVVLGTNIGTTFTAELITINIEQLILPLLLTGAILLFIHKQAFFVVGTVSFGLGCIFTAMRGFERLAPIIAGIPLINDLFINASSFHVIGVVIGIIVTAIIQSSSAVTGIVMGFTNEHMISLAAAVSIVLGSNLGTCVTAFLASIGSRKEARITAYSHIWINILSVICFYPLITIMIDVVSTVATSPDVIIAHISLIVNVVTSLALLPFVRPFTAFLLYLYDKPSAK